MPPTASILACRQDSTSWLGGSRWHSRVAAAGAVMVPSASLAQASNVPVRPASTAHRHAIPREHSSLAGVPCPQSTYPSPPQHLRLRWNLPLPLVPNWRRSHRSMPRLQPLTPWFQSSMPLLQPSMPQFRPSMRPKRRMLGRKGSLRKRWCARRVRCVYTCATCGPRGLRPL